METTPNDKKPKKGFLGAIWESMTKTGGCCGSGGSCCGSADPTRTDKKAGEKKDDRDAGKCSES
jgi:hypothetical protein